MTFHPAHDFSRNKERAKRAERSALENAHNRLAVLGIGFLILYCLVAFRLTELAFTWMLGGQKAAYYTRHTPKDKRIDIVDSQGSILATSLLTSSIYANPREILDIEETARKLSSTLKNLSYKKIKNKLKSKKQFVWISRNITPIQKNKVLELGLPGIEFSTEEKRLYPHKKTASHVIGFTNIDNKGLAGIERFFDKEILSSSTPIQLTIDVRIQAAVENELLQAVTKFNAQSGNAILMNANTGEIMAMATLPSYDPNLPNKINSKDLFTANTLGVYDLGSILKIFTAAMALEYGKTKIYDKYDATKPIHVDRFTISDYLGGEKRWLSVPEIILYSSNIGSAKMALNVGSKLQKEFFDRMGFFKKAPLELMELGTPLLPKVWGDIATVTISYGYGLAISPLHVVRAFAALVNGGYLINPTLIKKEKALIKTQVISEKTSKIIRKLLNLVVTKGTSKKAAVPGYFVGGKTGTAEKRNTQGKGFLKKSNITSFLGAFPIYDPKYIIYVQLDDPKGIKETHGFRAAGWNAAPTASNIIKRSLPFLKLLPNDENDPRIRELLHIDLPKKKPLY